LFVAFMTNSNLFKTNADLMVTPHCVESAVTLDNVQCSGSALEDKPTEYKDRNFIRISKLSKQFSFRAISAKPARVGRQEDQFAADLPSRLRIGSSQRRNGQHVCPPVGGLAASALPHQASAHRIVGSSGRLGSKEHT
jgi:hypothetical protein